MKSSLLNRIKTGVAALLMATTLVTTSGCLREKASEAPATESGELSIGLTDAQGDFASYTVNVTSLELTKANGAVVDALPLTTSVDFAQLTDMTEFLTAASIPNGAYVSAKMTLDYSAANIQVEDADGNAVPAAHVVDSNGTALTTLEVSVKLEGRNKLVIAPGIPASLTLDFDLAASNTVTFADNGEVTVTVEPFLLAELEPHAPKIHRARGALKSVDVANDQFTIIMRPFAHALSGGDERFGTLTVVTKDSTVFDINGETSEGDVGLQQMAALTQFTAVVAIGDLKLNPRRFVAREVYAGSSVAGGVLDVVSGNVISRSGDVLVVKGATLIRSGGSVVFNDTVTVQLDSDMTVRKQLSKDAFTIDAISVGQRINIFGTLTDGNAGSLAMTGSYARLMLTTLRGTVVTTAPLVVNVQSIDGRAVTLFDFAGTGTDTAHDADPANYEIDTGTLVLSGIAAGDTVKVNGIVTPFGSAPQDFTAQNVVDVSEVRAAMNIVWTPATTTPYSAISDASMTLNLAGSPLLHHVNRAGVLTDLATLGAAPILQAVADTDNVYLIAHNRVIQLYTTFDTFAAGLQSRLDAGAKVKGLHARGELDDATSTFSARNISVMIQ